MTESDPAARAKEVEARVEVYVHAAKRMILDLFGPEAAHDHNTAVITLAAAMANLEAGHIMADAQDRMTQALNDGEA